MSRAERRRLLARAAAAGGALLLGGCDRLSQGAWWPRVLGSAEQLNRSLHHLLAPRRAMAEEFGEADVSPQFRSNGTALPASGEYRRLAAGGFADWALQVDGLVEAPARFTLAQLRALPARTQITRHDCVEGWSAIGRWSGVPLAQVLERVRPTPAARYVVFHCADPMDANPASTYYESIDMEDALHPQTILAYELNRAALPVANGAPLRLRVERQLGYKMAKYLMRLELVGSFASIRGGGGGYWEDQGYEWYAGI